jgi:uncharacterized protein with PQ loop repeat
VAQRKSSDDISLGAAFIFSGGYIVWLAYGIAAVNWPLIVVDAIGIVTSGCALVLILRYRGRTAVAADE